MKTAPRRPRSPFPVVEVTTGSEAFDLRGWSEHVVDCILRLEGAPVVPAPAPHEETA